MAGAFSAFSAGAFLAVGYFHDEALWDRLVKRAMNTDFSWHKSALVYKQLYTELMEH